MLRLEKYTIDPASSNRTRDQNEDFIDGGMLFESTGF